MKPPSLMNNWIKYGIRRAVRENFVASQRACDLEKRSCLNIEQHRLLQDRLLRRTLERAVMVIPAYRYLAGNIPDTELAAFIRDRVPIIDKTELRERRGEYYPNNGISKPWWEIGRTSGTTGSPLEIFRDLDSAIWEHAFHLQHWGVAGLTPGDVQAVLRGDLVVPLETANAPYWFYDPFGRQLILSTRHLNAVTAPHFAAELSRLGIRQLRAYPSAAAELARLNELLGLGISFRTVITGSELLYPIQREDIERSFNARILDFYGMAERVAFVFQCERGGYHVHPEYSMVEIVDEHGNPTDDEGFIVGTTLHNFVMPLIRYRLNDTAQWRHDPCPCGRTYPMIEAIGGKYEERVYDLDGRVISPSIITFAFKGVGHIERAQVAQIAPDLWQLRIVPGVDFSSVDATTLMENFRNLVSARLNVELVLLDDVPNMSSGKYKWVSQESQLGPGYIGKVIV